MDHDPRQWVGLSNPSRSETGEGILRPSVDRSISAAIPRPRPGPDIGRSLLATPR